MFLFTLRKCAQAGKHVVNLIARRRSGAKSICFTPTNRRGRSTGGFWIPICQTDTLSFVVRSAAAVHQEPAIRPITGKISVKKRGTHIGQGGGGGAAVCWPPDGSGSRVAALVVFDELCSTKAKHLELPCGLSIWPSPYLPEPDAPKQLRAKKHE